MFSQICKDRVIISIHALREEGDLEGTRWHSDLHNFYPRPPRGGRQLSMFDEEGDQ